MILKLTYRIYLCFALTLLLSACSQTKEGSMDASTDAVKDTIEASVEDNEEVKLYSLPAPLQIPTAIKEACPDFYEDLLPNLKNNSKNYTSNFKQAVILGISAIDLGYSSIYDQTQHAITYIAVIVRLADQLKIIGSLEKDLIERYKSNRDNRDSLNYMILKSFNDINVNLNNDKRNDITLIVLAGSFIEGVYLSTSIYSKKPGPALKKVIAQQEIFLDNLLELLGDYKNQEDVSRLVKKFSELKEIYNQVDFKIKENKGASEEQIEQVNISEEDIKKIHEKISLIRNSLIN